MDHIQLVFQALWEAGLKIKMEKYAFVRKKLKYLRFKISWKGVSTDPDKIKTIVE